MSALVTHTPLLHPRIVREHVATHLLPDDVERRRGVMKGWIDALHRGALDDTKEVSLHGEWLTHVFGDVLGYRQKTTATDGGAYELSAEQSVGRSAKSADGALGFFDTSKTHIVAPIELKGAAQSLDSAKGRNQTPVQQAWEYASRAPESRWILVSNYKETRLYSKARGWDAYELFTLDALATDEGFRRFHALLCRDVFLPAERGAPSPLDRLLEASTTAQQDVTDRLYKTYRDIRHALFAELRVRHSNRDALELLPYAQTILDRVLFCAFAEDRGLIRRETIKTALEHVNPYDRSWTKWRSLCTVFAGVDKGNEILGLPPLNGGLFAPNDDLDMLDVTDALCERFREIAAYDFAEDVSVEVLGHVFEQSVTDLEELRAGATESAFSDTQRKPSKRRQEGVFYTPSFITRYLVDLTLGEVLREREEAAFASVYSVPPPSAEGGGKRATRASKERDLLAWERYREALRSVRVLDPSCGSGAFLIAAFETLAREYGRCNRALAELRGGQVEVFDLTTHALNENLFGVDLNGESVEITKLSLWLKTARKNETLAYLDRNVRRGNSVVDDPLVDPWAFDWGHGRTADSVLEAAPSNAAKAATIDARWREGFDVVIGNPPYVRQELLTRFKPHWSQRFTTYDGVADLFVYFFERGLRVLKPGGRLGFIVSNKWMRAGYAENLRGHLSETTSLERLVDFGHAPIFPDADAFPCIISARKPHGAEPRDPAHVVAVTQFPREHLTKVDVPEYVAEHTSLLPQSKFGRGPWALDAGDVDALMEKLRRAGTPLREFAQCKPYYGIKTGLNDAFLVDTDTRDRLVREDARSAELLKKYLRGQDVARWAPEWAGQWMIFARRGIDIDAFPAVRAHLERFRKRLEPRPRDVESRDWPGRKPGSYAWYELQDAIDYFEHFERPKLVFPDILWRGDFAVDRTGAFTNNTTYLLPTADSWLLAVLNSPAMWAFLWRRAQHAKDEALRMFGEFVEQLPIAPASQAQREACDTLVARLVAGTRENQAQRVAVLDLLRMQHGIETPGNKLYEPAALSSDEFVREVMKRRPKAHGGLSAGALKELRGLYDDDVAAIRARQSAMKVDEIALSRLVNEAYGLTPDEERLLWETAPPRMPDAR